MTTRDFQYLRIADSLRERIEGGLAPNTLLPTEHQLAREFGVSRVTIRQALHLLEMGGLVSRQRGRGTVVSPPKIVRHWSPISSFEEDLYRQGVELETRVLDYKREVTATPALRRRLQLAPEATVDVLSLLRLGNHRVLCYDRRYFASTIGPIDPTLAEHRPVLDIIRERTGRSTSRVSWEAEIVPASGEVAAALGITAGLLVVQTLGTGHLDDGYPIEVVDVFYRVDNVKFQFRGDYTIALPPRPPRSDLSTGPIR